VERLRAIADVVGVEGALAAEEAGSGEIVAADCIRPAQTNRVNPKSYLLKHESPKDETDTSWPLFGDRLAGDFHRKFRLFCVFRGSRFGIRGEWHGG
jgi:hypothetical protein